MDENILADFAAFWQRFFDLRKWPHHVLAHILGVGDDAISHWVHGNHAISPKHVSQLLEGGHLSHDEAAELVRLCLRHQGFSEKGLFHVSAALARQSTVPASGDRSAPESPCLLALSPALIAGTNPLSGSSPIFYSEILGALSEQATRHGYRLLMQTIPDIRAKQRLRDYYPDLTDLSGVVAITCQVEESTWLEECQAANIPIVLIHDNIRKESIWGKGRVISLWEDLGGLADLIRHLTRYHGCHHLRIVIADPGGHYHRQRKIDTIVRIASE